MIIDDAGNTDVTPSEQSETTPTTDAPVNDDGDSWSSSFDTEYSSLVADQGWQSTNDILSSFRLLKETLDQNNAGNSLALPKDEADAEGFDQIYKALGRPDSADEYEFINPDATGDAAVFDKTISEAMLGAGLSKPQAAKLAEAWNDYSTKLEAAKAAEFEAEVSEVKGFKPEILEAARRGFRFFGFEGDEFKAVASTLEVQLGPIRATEMMAKLGKALGEDKTLAGLNAGDTSQQTAGIRIQKMKDDPIFMKRYLSGDASAYAEMEELHKKVAAN